MQKKCGNMRITALSKANLLDIVFRIFDFPGYV